MQTKVAAILPVYRKDRTEHMSKAVESILCQTYRNTHLYIGMDGPVGDELKGSLEVDGRQDGVSIVWDTTENSVTVYRPIPSCGRNIKNWDENLVVLQKSTIFA